jgi:ketosteroid isomerase-like protein
MAQALLTVVLAACLITAGCSKSVDVEAERMALLDTDRAMASAVEAGDRDRVVSYWVDDSAIIPAGMPAVRGKDAILEFVAVNRAQPGFSITWEPHEAVVSQDGTLGYTIGDYVVSIDGPEGNKITRRGRYIQTWLRDEAGSWKCHVEVQAPLNMAGGPDLRPGQANP